MLAQDVCSWPPGMRQWRLVLRHGHARRMEPMSCRFVRAVCFVAASQAGAMAQGGWTQVPVTGPSARAPAMAYDSQRGRTVLFGGLTLFRAPPLGDTWEWDGSTWVQLA